MSSNFLLLNARSICNKVHFLHLYVAFYKPSFVAITETWANKNIPDSIFAIDGYNLFRKDRIGNKGGGIMLFVNKSLKCFINESLTNDEYEESLWCNIWFGSDPLLLGIVYRPPCSNIIKNQLLNNLLSRACQSKPSCKLIVGDFNYPFID